MEKKGLKKTVCCLIVLTSDTSRLPRNHATPHVHWAGVAGSGTPLLGHRRHASLASVEPQRSRGFFELNYCSKQLLSSTADCAALLSALAEAGSGGGLGACAENKRPCVVAVSNDLPWRGVLEGKRAEASGRLLST